MDKDQVNLKKLIEQHADVFNTVVNVDSFRFADFKSRLEDLLLDTRIDQQMLLTGDGFEASQKAVLEQLEFSKD